MKKSGRRIRPLLPLFSWVNFFVSYLALFPKHAFVGEPSTYYLSTRLNLSARVYVVWTAKQDTMVSCAVNMQCWPFKSSAIVNMNYVCWPTLLKPAKSRIIIVLIVSTSLLIPSTRTYSPHQISYDALEVGTNYVKTHTLTTLTHPRTRTRHIHTRQTHSP